MKLERLDIRRLPGLPGPLALAPDPDRVTVVVGPNASGKTSLLRALAMLLDPHPAHAEAEIEAVFRDGARRITGRAFGPARTWLEDGREIARPDWPGPDLLGAFLIRADALVEPGLDPTGDRLSAQLRRAMAGGLDIDAVLAAPPFAARSRPRQIFNEWTAARREIGELERRQTELADEVDRLGEMRQRHERARQAQLRVPAIDRAQQWLELEHDLEAAEASLAEFPAALARLSGDEPERLERIDRRRAELERQIRAEREDLAAARDQRRKLGIADPAALEPFVAALDESQRALGRLEQQRQQAIAEIEGAAAERDAARRQAGAVDPKAEDQPDLDGDALDRLETLAAEVAGARSRVDTVEARLAGVERGLDEGDAEPADRERDLVRAIDTLRRWLRAAAPRPAALTAWSLLLLAAGVGAAWAWRQPEWAGYAPLIMVAGALALTRMIGLGHRAWRARRIRSDWPRPLTPPASWTDEAVAARLDALEDEQRAMRERQARRQNAAERAAELAAERDRAVRALDDARDALAGHCRACGVAPEWAESTRGLLRLRALAQANRAEAGLRAEKARLAAIEGELDRFVDTVVQRLADHDQPVPETIDAAQLAAIGDDLRRRLGRAGRADQRIDDAERRLAQLEREDRDLADEREALLARAGLAPDEDGLLADRVASLASYRELQRRIVGLRHTRNDHRAALAGDAELVGIAETGDRARLATLADETRREADAADALGERISRIEFDRNRALQEKRLAELVAERERKRIALENELDLHRDAAAGRFLLERARAGHEQAERPALLERARKLLGRMTRGRHELVFDGRNFGARDRETGAVQALAELSTATRVQLLLALRLAWIEQAERGGPELPVFLDEVLATTDPGRYRAVVEALQQIRAEGRQLIYLSSQPADAEAWKHFAGEPAPAIIELVELVELAAPPETSFAFAPAPEPVCPDPKLDPADWARAAGIRPIDPWQPADRVALFHIARDRLDALNRLRVLGIDTVGEWQHARAIELEAGLEPALAETLDKRAAAAGAWLERWRRGHVPPVDPMMLVESDAVSETFREAVLELNRELGSDAGALIEALRDGRVKGFFTKKTDELEQEFAAAGLLDEPDPPGDAELIDALLRTGGLAPEAAADLNRWLQAGLEAAPSAE